MSEGPPEWARSIGDPIRTGANKSVLDLKFKGKRTECWANLRQICDDLRRTSSKPIIGVIFGGLRDIDLLGLQLGINVYVDLI